MEIKLACGEMFKGTVEELKALKIACPEKFVAPTVALGKGSKSSLTETEKEKWNKGRIFGLVWAAIIAEDKLNSAINGKEDLSMFDKKEVKDILKAETQDKIKAKFLTLGLDYEEHLECYKYKKECDKAKTKK